ncbi:MAG: radical SAM protein [Thermoguttaceae bacterium]
MDELAQLKCRAVRKPVQIGKRLRLSSIPEGLSVSHVDLDLTLDCNLRCVYCFKTEKERVDIQERTAFDAVIWLLHACGPEKKAGLSLMGGEPLMNYSLIKRWIPFVRRRAAQENVEIDIGMTTNCTLVSDEVVDFWKRWGLTFHSSIDGIPKVQDANRPMVTGGASSQLAERGVGRSLREFPETTARCTVAPDTVGSLHEGYLYFRKLGYSDIAMVPGNFDQWDDASIAVYEEQFRRIADAWIGDLRGGTWVSLKNIDDFMQGREVDKRATVPCGAGRNMVAIDVYGNLWPCSRMTKKEHENWCLGRMALSSAVSVWVATG